MLIPKNNEEPTDFDEATSRNPKATPPCDVESLGRRDLYAIAPFAARTGMRGLGIDEGTALLIEKFGGAWNWSVDGEGAVYVVTPSSTSVRPTYSDGSRLSIGPMNIFKIGPTSRTVVSSLFQMPNYRIWVSKGTAFTSENGGIFY